MRKSKIYPFFYRKLIKYNTPISVAMFINLGFVDQELYVLLSSTIGPAALWALKFDHEVCMI